jgi:DNA-binding PadR family transcriptional regulator
MPPFGRRFNRPAGEDWEGWTPPWMQEEWHGPGPHPRVFIGRFGRHFFGPRGPFGPHGPGGESRRVFGRGDLKYVLLELLQERPMHGYEMMRALEDRSGGFYSPSAGSIYPTLQMLEDRGLVTVAESEGKKVYSITDAGRAFLGERQREEEEFAGPPWAREFGRRWRAPEMQALRSEAMEVARLFTIAGRMSFRDQAQLNHLHDILERTRKELSDMIYGAGAPTPPSGSESAPTEPQQD